MAYEYSSNSSRRNGYDNRTFSKGYDRIFGDSKTIKDRLALNKFGKVTRVVPSSKVSK